MKNILAYIELAAGVQIAVSAIRAIWRAKKQTTGAELLAACWPALNALHGILPNAAIPDDLAIALCNACADVLNVRFAAAAPKAVEAAAA